MEKHNLIGLALDQLIESFAASPECFIYESRDYTPDYATTIPTIIWQPKIQLKDELIDDPNGDHRSMIISFNPNSGEFNCYIFFRYVGKLSDMVGIKADAVMTSRQLFPKLRSNHRKFKKLIRLIKARDLAKENETFLKKLCRVFPTTLDQHIFK